MINQPNSPQVRVTDILRQFAGVVARLHEHHDLVVVPDELMEETNPQARLQRMSLSPERYVVRSVDISPQLMRPFQALLRDFIDIAVDELRQRGVEIPELQTILSYYGARRELDRATLLSPSFARALNVILDHPALRPRLVDLEQRLMSRNRQHYTTVQQSCIDQAERGSRLFVIGVDRYILNRMVERTTLRATHHQIVERPQPPSGREAQMVYAQGSSMLYELDRQRQERMRNRIQDLFRIAEPEQTSPPPSPAQQVVNAVPDTELVREMFPTGRLTPDASASLAGQTQPARPLSSDVAFEISRPPLQPERLPGEVLEFYDETQTLDGPIYSVMQAVSHTWMSVYRHTSLVDPRWRQHMTSLHTLNESMRDLSQLPFGHLTIAMDAALAALVRRSVDARARHRPSKRDVREVISSTFSAMGIDLPVSDELVDFIVRRLRASRLSSTPPYQFMTHQTSENFIYSWSDLLRGTPDSFIDYLKITEWSDLHPVALAFRALGYDYTPEQVGELIWQRLISPPTGALTMEHLSHLPVGLSSVMLRIAESGQMSAEDLRALAYEMSSAYGQQDIYTGRVYVLLPGRERVEAYQADVRDFPLPNINVDLGFEQEVLHPRTEGLLWRGENLRRFYEHVLAGNVVILTEEQLKRMFRERMEAAEQVGAYYSAMGSEVRSEGSYAGGRHAVTSDVAERSRNLLGFLFEAMETDDAEEEDPYDNPTPEVVMSWDADYISSQVMYRRRIGRGRSERVIRGPRRLIQDVMPEQLLIHRGREAERSARALMGAMEQLERRGEYTATGPMGSLIQVQQVDDQGNVVIREWTLEEYLRAVAPQATVSPIPVSAIPTVRSPLPALPAGEADMDEDSGMEDAFRAELAEILARRADYGVIFGGADLVSMFHAMENAYSRAVQENQHLLESIRRAEELVSEMAGEDVTLDRRNLYASIMSFQDRIAPERRNDFILLSRAVLSFRESLLRNLQEEMHEFANVVLEERHLRNLARRLIEAYPDYEQHGTVVSGHVFSRFIFGLAREMIYRSSVIEQVSTPVVQDLMSVGAVNLLRFSQGVNALAQAFGIRRYDERARQALAAYLYRELVGRGVDVNVPELALRRMTGLSMNELERLVGGYGVEPQGISQVSEPASVGQPADVAPSSPQQGSDLQPESPVVPPTGLPVTEPEDESRPWRGSEQMLEALGMSETNLFGAARRRFLRIFGWVDEQGSELRRRLNEQLTPEAMHLVTRLFENRYGEDEVEQRLADQARFTQITAILRHYAPDEEELDRLARSTLWNPANFSIARALYHLITDDPNSRLSIALRRAYLGAVGSTEAGADMLTDLGLAAFQFAAEFVRTTPPGARVGEFGIMPSDPDEVAQFLSENLLGLMIRHALRSTSREEAFGILREMSLEQSTGGGDEDAPTIQDVIADRLTVRSPEHGGPALSEDLAGQESAPAPPAPERPRSSRFERQGYASPNRLEGGISEAIRRQDEIVRSLREADAEGTIATEPVTSSETVAPSEHASPAEQPAAVAEPEADIPISHTTRYLRYVSGLLSELEAGRMTAEEARRALRGAQVFVVGGHVAASVPIYIGGQEVPVTVFPGGRVSLAGRTLSLEERDPYPIAPEMVNPIPQQIMRPVDPVHERALPALIWVRHEADAAPGLAMDVGMFERLSRLRDDGAGLVALDIETDPETGAFLQGAMALYSAGSDDIGRNVRLVLSNVDIPMAMEQLENLVQLARQTQPNYRRRARFVMEALGLVSDEVQSKLETMFRERADAGEIASRLAGSPGVLLSEQEALARYIHLLVGAARERQLVVQNVAFDIPYLIERAEHLSLQHEAERLRGIQLQEALDVAEMASAAGYGQVNLEYLGHQVGALAAEQREAHLALDDAILTARVERAMSERLSSLRFESLENRYLVGLGPGRLYALDNPLTPEQVTGLRDRIFRVVQAGYSLDQMRAFMELEEVQFREGEVVPVRRLRFEPMLDENQHVQPMWQAVQEMNRMFTAVDEEEVRRIYDISMQDLFRREVERILAPDLPPDMTVRHGQLPSEYEREGLITSMMTLLRARAMVEGIPDPTDIGWVRHTLNASIDDELALHLVQRAAYYFTTPYVRDPRRQEIYRRVWEWWNQEGRREQLGELLSDLMQRGMDQQLSWSEMTAIWRDVISQEIERIGLPQVQTEVPFYRQDTASLAVALRRGGFATVSVPMGISDQAQEEWLLHRVRTQLRRQVLGSRFGIEGAGTLLGGAYQSSVLEDVGLLSGIEDPGDYEEALRVLAERRARAVHLQDLSRRLQAMEDQESAEAVAIQNQIQEHMARMAELEEELRSSGVDAGRAAEFRSMFISRFLGELNRDRRLRETLDDYIMRVVLPVDTMLRDYLETGEGFEVRVPSREGAVRELLDMARSGVREEQRVAVEQFVPSERLREDMESRWEAMIQRARARNVAERIQQTLEELGVRGFRVTEADMSTRIPLHAAALALHDAVSELAARGEPVTLADISELMRQRLGVDVLQVGRYHSIDLTSPESASALLSLMRRTSGWIGRYASEIDEEWLDYMSRQMFRAMQLRGITLLGARGIMLEDVTRTPFPVDVYGDWIRSAWGEITPGAWADISAAVAVTGEGIGAGEGAGAGADTGAGAGAAGAAGAGARGGGFGFGGIGGDGGAAGQDASFNFSSAVSSSMASVALSFVDDLILIGAGAVAFGYAWYRRRKRRAEEEENADEVRLVRRGTGISGATRFLVQANPFIRQPAHHIPFDVDYRRPSSARLRRMERDMEELL